VSDLQAFVRRLLTEDLPEIDVAVGALWFMNKNDPADTLSTRQIEQLIVDAGGSRPNTTRLRKRLEADGRVTNISGSFRVNSRRTAALDERFKPFSGPMRPANSGSVLPVEAFSNARPYVRDILHQLNASYDEALFDCCAVMCRRIYETLLIDTFDRQQAISLIQDAGGDIVALSNIISTLKCQRAFTVGRTTKNAAAAIKKIGDLSAHNRTFIARQKHIDDISADLYAACLDLLHLSGQD
jgi:hypothetical protein